MTYLSNAVARVESLLQTTWTLRAAATLPPNAASEASPLPRNRADARDKKASPAPMRSMTLEDKRAHVASVAAQRDQVKAQIKEVSQKRAKAVAEERAKQGSKNGLDDAIRSQLEEQLEANGLTLEEH